MNLQLTNWVFRCKLGFQIYVLCGDLPRVVKWIYQKYRTQYAQKLKQLLKRINGISFRVASHTLMLDELILMLKKINNVDKSNIFRFWTLYLRLVGFENFLIFRNIYKKSFWEKFFNDNHWLVDSGHVPQVIKVPLMTWIFEK